MTAFYNDVEPDACAWMHQLQKRGLIAKGDISRESIRYLDPEALAAYTQVHLFAGIGGWSYALRLAGWPDDLPVWTGSCPCQPFSAAGKRKGTSDKRHLWPQMFRLIAERRPGVVFGEQVAGKAGLGWLDGVFADLEGAGYACGAVVLGAHSVGAPHIRQRLFWVADRDGERCEEREESNGGAQRSGLEASRRDNAGGRGASGGLADGSGGGCGERGDAALARSGGHADGGRGADGLADGESVQLNGGMERGICAGEVREAGENERSSSRRSGGARRMGEPDQPRSQGHAGDGDDGDQPGRIGTVEAGSVAETGDGGGMGDTECSEAERLGEHRLRALSKEKARGRYHTVAGPWSRFDIIPCGDGKARRIEPGLAPLAHGVPARVVRLRGYGNAIVPQVAAEFIRAYMELKMVEQQP